MRTSAGCYCNLFDCKHKNHRGNMSDLLFNLHEIDGLARELDRRLTRAENRIRNLGLTMPVVYADQQRINRVLRDEGLDPDSCNVRFPDVKIFPSGVAPKKPLCEFDPVMGIVMTSCRTTQHGRTLKRGDVVYASDLCACAECKKLSDKRATRAAVVETAKSVVADPPYDNKTTGPADKPRAYATVEDLMQGLKRPPNYAELEKKVLENIWGMAFPVPKGSGHISDEEIERLRKRVEEAIYAQSVGVFPTGRRKPYTFKDVTLSVYSLNDDGTITPLPPGYVPPPQPKVMGIPEALWEVCFHHKVPERAKGLPPKVVRGLQRIADNLAAQAKRITELSADLLKANADASAAKHKADSELPGLREAYKAQLERANKLQVQLQDYAKDASGRVNGVLIYGAKFPEAQHQNDHLAITLQGLWRDIQSLRAQAKTPEDIERNTTKRLTEELRAAISRGPHASPDLKQYRYDWVGVLQRVRDIVEDNHLAVIERTTGSCTNDLRSVLNGLTKVEDIPSSMNGAWATQLRAVFALKDKVKAKVDSEVSAVLQEAARLVAERKED